MYLLGQGTRVMVGYDLHRKGGHQSAVLTTISKATHDLRHENVRICNEPKVPEFDPWSRVLDPSPIILGSSGFGSLSRL